MLKILIWDLSYTLKNSGGPAGYLYNIKEYLNDHQFENCEIYFLKDVLGIPNIDNSMNANHKGLINRIYKLDVFSLVGYYRSLRCLRGWNKKTSKEIIRNINLNDYDVIHFHHSGDLYRASQLLMNYEGKIFLTSHSPQPQSYEDSEYIVYKHSIIRKIIRRILLQKELEAWSMATYLMFPVEEALEPYFVENKIKVFKESNPQKFIYCESAILDKPISKPISKKELGVDDNKILVCYVGRHNVIKGYDQLKLFAKRILNNDDRFEFVIAGNEEPLKRLDNRNWKELGWIKYGSNVISAADFFILPNKETYFDLVTLEVMREGTPILMANTGGNKYFNKYGSEYGFFLYQYGNLEDEEEKFYMIVDELKKGILLEKSKKIRMLFESQFTIASYLKRYVEVVASVCK